MTHIDTKCLLNVLETHNTNIARLQNELFRLGEKGRKLQGELASIQDAMADTKAQQENTRATLEDQEEAKLWLSALAICAIIWETLQGRAQEDFQPDRKFLNDAYGMRIAGCAGYDTFSSFCKKAGDAMLQDGWLETAERAFGLTKMPAETVLYEREGTRSIAIPDTVMAGPAWFAGELEAYVSAMAAHPDTQGTYVKYLELKRIYE